MDIHSCLFHAETGIKAEDLSLWRYSDLSLHTKRRQNGVQYAIETNSKNDFTKCVPF